MESPSYSSRIIKDSKEIIPNKQRRKRCLLRTSSIMYNRKQNGKKSRDQVKPTSLYYIGVFHYCDKNQDCQIEVFNSLNHVL